MPPDPGGPTSGGFAWSVFAPQRRSSLHSSRRAPPSRRRSRSRIRISITTGGTGGVYYPLGGGMANVLSKYIPGLQATAEVTGGSVDNLKLIGAGKSEVGFSMVDAA